VPADAAVVAAFRLSEAEGLGAARTAATWHATGLDIGREIFGNIDDAVLFLVPPGDEARGGPIPDVAVVLDVKDPGRSEALWSELLRVGATIAREDPEVLDHAQIAGRDVRVYRLPDRVNLYFCALEDRVVLSVTEHAMARALGVAAGEPSLLDTDRYREAVAGVQGASKIAIVDIGSVLASFGPLLDIPQREANQIREVVGESLVTLSTRETASSLRGSVRIGWPRVGPWLREMLGKERVGRGTRSVARATRRAEREVARLEVRQARKARRPRATSRTAPSSPEAPSSRSEPPELVKELIPLGALWSYFDQGTDPGPKWNDQDSEDNAWKKGKAPLGYGDKALATVVVSYGGNARKKHPTTFFRSTFTVDNPQQFDALRMRVRRDDGVAVYSNGKLVARNNPPKGASWQDYCSAVIGGNDEMRYLVLPVNLAAIRAGKNVIAVEIHQASPGSSDIAFDRPRRRTETRQARPRHAVKTGPRVIAL